MKDVDFTHEPEARCWVEGADGHAEFPVQNLPLGVFSPAGDPRQRGGIAIGDMVLDLAAVGELLEEPASRYAALANTDCLNSLLAEGRLALRELRRGVFRLLTEGEPNAQIRNALYSASECRFHLPVKVGDYTDFYTGIHHAERIGRQFRPENPLLPNYKYVPIGYHGRASSIRMSGLPVKRPSGQTKATDADAPQFVPTKRLDYELEMGIWVGRGNELGEPLSISEAADAIAGISILNDWSARDIQAWEYQPLGPFLAKNFHSTISPWIVTMDALAPFRTAQPERPEGDPAPLPYLLDAVDQANGALAVTLQVELTSARMRAEGLEPKRLSRAMMTSMYWTPAQLVTHHSSNGCNLRAGDLLGTGTLSGSSDDSLGSLMELTCGGKDPITLPSGETRTFLENGDEVIMRAGAQKDGFVRIGLGECRAVIVD